MERDFSARRRHFRERRHADRNVIADPVSFHNRLVRMFGQQSSSKMRDHRGYCTAVQAGTAQVGTAAPVCSFATWSCGFLSGLELRQWRVISSFRSHLSTR